MVHRDIKPSNLLVQPSLDPANSAGMVKITDFGLAQLTEDNAVADSSEPGESIFGGHSVVMGTPDYLSPEQGRSLESVDIRSDIYSLGCTLYYLLTGEAPFPGGTPLEKVTRHATTEPEPVEHLRPVVPPGVAAIVRRMMAKSADLRHQTPAEVADTLESFAEDRPVIWSPNRAGSLPSTGSLDLMADGSASESSRNLFGGTQTIDRESTALSLDEIKALRGPDRRRTIRYVLFLAAAVIGFVIGAILIANSMTTRPWPS
jgi:serine/threonine protein kinase